ncbi:hypothetical protein, partial [Marinobacterium litorale]|uniref:hypothetical protein n=1 Tax=Marinobacterium litorale TaxID=404770 RepID=UPI001B7FA564
MQRQAGGSAIGIFMRAYFTGTSSQRQIRLPAQGGTGAALSGVFGVAVAGADLRHRRLFRTPTAHYLASPLRTLLHGHFLRISLRIHRNEIPTGGALIRDLPARCQSVGISLPSASLARAEGCGR